MNLVRLLPVVLSLLVLAAHFLRSGGAVAVLFVLMVMGLLLVRRGWVSRVVQVVLVVGFLEWVRTLMVLISVRRAAGESWTRMAIILGTVAMITLASALIFRLPAVKRRYSG